MLLISYEINLFVTWSEDCVNSSATGATKFAVVALSTQVNAELLEELKSSFKKTVNWNKYQPKSTTQTQN